jgi:opacity protein-like surface antigen
VKTIIIAILALLLLAGSLTDLAANPLQRTRITPQWTVDLGGGWFVPSEDGLDDRYQHGYNGRLALNYQVRSGFQFGANYRISTKEAIYAPGDLDHTSHWLGLRLGYDLARRWDMEVSIGGNVYFVWIGLDGRARTCPSDPNCTSYASFEDSEGGLGLGAAFIYAYQLNEVLGLGFEFEYNHSFLNRHRHYPAGGSVVDDSVVPLRRYYFDNVGGIWLAPFVRIRF